MSVDRGLAGDYNVSVLGRDFALGNKRIEITGNFCYIPLCVSCCPALAGGVMKVRAVAGGAVTEKRV